MRGIKGTLRFFAPSIIVGLAAPFVFPAIRRAVRPAAKGLVKGTLSLSESIKEGAAEAREQISDLLAEVKATRSGVAGIAIPEEMRALVRWSDVPGRVRWDAPALHHRPRLCAAVEDAIRAIVGVRTAQVNPLTGSVLVHYDRTETNLIRLEAATHAALALPPLDAEAWQTRLATRQRDEACGHDHHDHHHHASPVTATTARGEPSPPGICIWAVRCSEAFY